MTTNSPIVKAFILPLIGLLWGALCTTALAASPATAVLRTSANVRVNGATIARPTMLFSGDVVHTADLAVSLEMTGSGILLDKDTTAILEDDQLNLICGGALIKTLKGLGARVEKLEIRPSSQSARFEILRQQKSIRITALDGDLKISDGRQKIVLNAGRQLELSCSQCVQDTASAQGINSFVQVDTALNSSCDLPAASALVTQPIGGLNPIGAAMAGAVGPAVAVWILLETPISPDHP